MKKIALVALAAIFMFACQAEKKETTDETPVDEMVLLEDTPVEDTTTIDVRPEETFYKVRGIIVEIPEADAEGNAMVMVSHEEIPDVMGAMQMALKSNVAYLSEIGKDDKVSFELVKTDEGYIMRNVAKLPAETELVLKK